MLKDFQLKKVYLYVLAVIVFFVLLWGAIDTVSAGLGLVLAQPSSSSGSGMGEELGPDPESDAPVEALYQRRMFFERIADSSARLLIGGGVFVFLTLKIKKEEEA